MDAPRRGTILYVDDHAQTRAVVKPLLLAAGYVIHTCSTAKEAASISVALRFDLLVVDIGLPDSPEVALLANLRLLHPIKGIALTEPGTTGVPRSIEAGFDQYLTKPVTPDQLLEAIQFALGGAPEPRRPGEAA